MDVARDRQQRLTKPPGSLGRLESLAVQIAGATGQPRPRLDRRAVVVMAADHGLADEGVSAYPAEVTAQMVGNFLGGGAAINALARQAGVRVVVVDVGVRIELAGHPALIRRKVAPGTANMTQAPAMSREQARAALEAGIEVVEREAEAGLDALALGEMGIGNTAAAAAVASTLSGHSPETLIGRGTGVDEAGLSRKMDAVHRALQINQPDPADPLDVLSKVGGLELAGLVGATLAAAAARCPVIVDGYPATAAAMAAAAIAPAVESYLIAGHRSEEGGHGTMLDWLGLEPVLDLQMRLGEGSGAVLAMPVIEAACRTLDEMATFEEARVSGGGAEVEA
jgi:nicotinate-nucleotide--dimethylbenzimidazole phosphoribosyltransferase